MNFSDFEFNGKRLSHFDCIVGSVSNSDETTVPSHTPITLNTFRQYGSNQNRLVRKTYDEAGTVELGIVKNNCYGDIYFLDDEFKKIVTWLETDRYEKLKVFYDDGSFNDVMFYAMCTGMSTVRGVGGIAEIRITFTLNAPFGYSEPIVIKETLEANGSFDVIPDSDEIGILLPTLFHIKLNAAPPSSGLVITNSLDNESCILKGCSPNEVVELDCRNKLISAKTNGTNSRTDLYKYFNFFYPRLIVKRDKQANNDVITNVFTINTACDVEFTYQNVRKVGVLI